MTIATMPERVAGRKLGDVRAVAEKLDCSPRHVYRMADAGADARTSPPCLFGPMGLGKNRPGLAVGSWKKVRSTRGWRNKDAHRQIECGIAAVPSPLPTSGPSARAPIDSGDVPAPAAVAPAADLQAARQLWRWASGRAKPNPPGLPQLRPVSRAGVNGTKRGNR